jgi:hypothetical protein
VSHKADGRRGERVDSYKAFKAPKGLSARTRGVQQPTIIEVPALLKLKPRSGQRASLLIFSFKKSVSKRTLIKIPLD